MAEKERFTVDSDGKYWDKINHKYVNLDYLFRLVEELDSELNMSREKALYWRNKAEDIWGDMKTNVELKRENIQLKNELKELKEYEDGDE